MTQITVDTQLSFKEYLTYEDGTDNCYELEDGKLILMNPPTGRHALIIRLLTNLFEAEIKRLRLPWVTLSGIGIRTSIKRSRIPDISIITQNQISEYLDISAVIESASLLAIEVVSPESKIRDYRYKRSEYSVVGIPEYWIIDPSENKVIVLLLVEGLYEETEYQGTNRIVSQIFPELELTVEQIFQV